MSIPPHLIDGQRRVSIDERRQLGARNQQVQVGEAAQ